MSNIREILDDGYQVNLTMKETVALADNLVSDDVLREGKRKVLAFAVDYLKQEFVEAKYTFPKDGLTDVEFSVDLVVLKGDDYRRLKKLLDNE